MAIEKKDLLNMKKAIKEKMKEMKDQLKSTGEKYMKRAFRKVFADNESLESFAWTQYTCYFCDGDPCYFSANSESLYINGKHIDDCEYESTWECERKIKEHALDDVLRERWKEKLAFAKAEQEKKDSLASQISEILEAFDDDDLEYMFGDHVKVIVSRDKIETEDYSDHD